MAFCPSVRVKYRNALKLHQYALSHQGYEMPSTCAVKHFFRYSNTVKDRIKCSVYDVWSVRPYILYPKQIYIKLVIKAVYVDNFPGSFILVRNGSNKLDYMENKSNFELSQKRLIVQSIST
jgi:hypothetical protein